MPAAVKAGGGSPAGPGSAKKGKGAPKGKKSPQGKGGGGKPDVKVPPMPHTPPEHRTPAHAVKYSAKRGVVFVHVNLPKSVPESVINLDAKPQGFHLDTGKWGGGYKLDVAWPEGVKVHLKEGEEAEAELNGGNLRVCFYVEGGEALLKKQGKSGKDAGAKSIHKDKKRKSVEGKGGEGAEVSKASKGEKKQGTPVKTGEKRVRDVSGPPGESERPLKKKKTLVESKDLALKLVDDVSGTEERKLQEKEDMERERLERVKQVQEKREERREAKKNKKESLVKNLKAQGSKKQSGGDDEEESPKKAPKVASTPKSAKKGAKAAGGDADAGEATASGKKRRVSWGTDQVRKFHS